MGLRRALLRVGTLSVSGGTLSVREEAMAKAVSKDAASLICLWAGCAVRSKWAADSAPCLRATHHRSSRTAASGRGSGMPAAQNGVAAVISPELQTRDRAY